MSDETEDRALRARIAAHTSWGMTVDRTARTSNGRRAFDQKFLDAVPAEITNPEARRLAAENLRKAYYLNLARQSAIARARRAKR